MPTHSFDKILIIRLDPDTKFQDIGNNKYSNINSLMLNFFYTFLFIFRNFMLIIYKIILRKNPNIDSLVL